MIPTCRHSKHRWPRPPGRARGPGPKSWSPAGPKSQSTKDAAWISRQQRTTWPSTPWFTAIAPGSFILDCCDTEEGCRRYRRGFFPCNGVQTVFYYNRKWATCTLVRRRKKKRRAFYWQKYEGKRERMSLLLRFPAGKSPSAKDLLKTYKHTRALP